MNQTTPHSVQYSLLYHLDNDPRNKTIFSYALFEGLHILGPTLYLCLIILGSCYVHPALLLGHPTNSEMAKLPFNNSSFGRSFSGKFSEKGFPESFRKKTYSGRRICDFRKYPQTTSGRTSSGSFRKNLLPEVTFF